MRRGPGDGWFGLRGRTVDHRFAGRLNLERHAVAARGSAGISYLRHLWMPYSTCLGIVSVELTKSHGQKSAP
jgi:hypothetical protein